MRRARQMIAPLERVVGTCTWCRGAVPPKRRTWCSQACVYEYRIRTDPRFMRRELRRRDHEVCQQCGLDCRGLARFLRMLGAMDLQVHTEETARMLRWSRLTHAPSRPAFGREMTPQMAAWIEEIDRLRPKWGPVNHRTTTDGRIVALDKSERPYRNWRDWWGCEVMGLTRADARRRSYWEADHRVTVAEGGGGLGLENLVTLCLWCHRKKSADDNRRIRAKRREREVSSPPPPPVDPVP